MILNFWPLPKDSQRSQMSEKQKKKLEKRKLSRLLTNDYDNEHIIYLVQKQKKYRVHYVSSVLNKTV